MRTGEKNNYSRKHFLMPTHPLISFKIQRHYQNDAQLSSKNKSTVKQAQQRLNGYYSRNNLPKLKA